MNKTVFDVFKDDIKSILGVDDYVTDILREECIRDIKHSPIDKYPSLFYGLLSIITSFLYLLKGVNTKVKTREDDFILVSCPVPVFHTNTIDLIASNLSYCIIFLPNYHISSALRYDKYFKRKGIIAYFPEMKMRYVLSAKRRIKGIAKKILKYRNDNESKRIISVLTSFLIYSQIVADYMTQTSSFRGKWILEHQKFYFIPMVAYLHSHSIQSTMLQHGIFFEPVYDYIPLICDKVLCCSNREKEIYINSGTEETRVDVFGAPIQTIQPIEKKQTTGRHFDMLILLTEIDEHNNTIISEVIEYIKNHYKSVLVRMRPGSRKKDLQLLEKDLEGMTISAKGTSIGDDIRCCDKVVSFSVDANIEVAKNNKPFIYIWDQESTDSVGNLNCATKDNYKREINKLMEEEFYSSFSKEKYVEILGETDVNVLRERFERYIKDE